MHVGRDDERLRDANIANRERLLDRLRSAVAVFEGRGADGYLRYLPEYKEYKDIRKLATLSGNGATPNGEAGTPDAETEEALRTKLKEKIRDAE